MEIKLILSNGNENTSLRSSESKVSIYVENTPLTPKQYKKVYKKVKQIEKMLNIKT